MYKENNHGDMTHTLVTSSHKTFMRKTFTVEDASACTSLVLSVIYDEDPVVYINGEQVWSATGYHDGGYVDASLDTSLLKNGENTIYGEFKNDAGEWVEIGKVDALIEGKTTAIEDVETTAIKVQVTTWNNDNWKCIAELSIKGEKIEKDTPVDPVDPPQAGDASAIIAVLAVVALFGAAVVTKKAFVK